MSLFIYVSVLHFKSNDQNPTVDPPFRPPEGAQLKRPRRDPVLRCARGTRPTPSSLHSQTAAR